MSVDLRTRTDGPRLGTDPDAFFGQQLPAALETSASGISAGAGRLELRPLTVEVDGTKWTLSWTGDRVDVARGGQDRGAHVRTTAEQLDDLVSDQATIMGFWSSGRLDQPAGRLGDALDWWLVLRAALDHRPLHTPGAVTFHDRDGDPLDPAPDLPRR